MTIYTLIAYRPNGEAYRSGERTDSRLEVFCTDNLCKIRNLLTEFMYFDLNYKDSPEYGALEFFILADGTPIFDIIQTCDLSEVYDDDTSWKDREALYHEVSALVDAARAHAKERWQAEQDRKALEAAKRMDAKSAAERERDLAEFNRLKQKLGM